MNKNSRIFDDKKSDSTTDNSFNGNLSAQPLRSSTHKLPPEEDLSEKQVDYGDMNLRDAKISGYTDRKGNAISMAKEDIPGEPTGAYTDIGAGRSSAVSKNFNEDKNQKH